MLGSREWYCRETTIEISVKLVDTMGKFFNLTGEIRNKDKVSLTVSFALALVKDEGK